MHAQCKFTLYKMQIIQLYFLFILFKTIFCRQSICKIEDKICGNSCYNSENVECIEGIICSKGQHLCTDRCYSSDSQECVNGKDVCPIGEVKCSNNGQYKCYDSKNFNCTSCGAICLFDEQGCGWNCYKPPIQICDELSGTICNKDEEYCGDQCFNSIKDGTNKKCSIDKRAICELNELGCGSKCYSPSENKLQCFDGILCKINEKLCQYECYDPNIEVCFNNTKICHLTKEPCGEYYCYSPHNETCYTEDRERYSPSPCDNTLSPCGYECYDPKKKSCLEYMDGMKLLCELGDEICGQRCHSLPDNENKCMNRTLCKNDEQVCGQKCYNPNKSGLTCYNNKALCNIGKKPCGCGCYDPEIDKCVEFPDSMLRWPEYSCTQY